MSDALCGPSNALQNFQKHTSVDRTLQQDRLISRQSPQQDFRSAHGQHAGAIDPEFEAFQAGHPPPQHEALRFPAQHAPPPNFAGPAGLPDWAADFQRLNVSSPPPLQQQQHFQAQAPRHNHTASWHQDFLQQQHAASPSPGPQMSAGSSRTMYPGAPMMGFGAGQFAHQQPFMAQQQDINAKAKQKDPVFDNAAFENAFDAAAAEVLEAEKAMEAPAVAQAEQQPATSSLEERRDWLLPPENDPTLAYMKEYAFNEYVRHQMSEYLPRAGGVRDTSTIPDHSLASLYMGVLENMESTGELKNSAPDPLLERVLSEIVGANDILYEGQFMFRARAARLRDQIKTNFPSYLNQEESQIRRANEDPQLRAMRMRMLQQSLQGQNELSVMDAQRLDNEKVEQLVSQAGHESRLLGTEPVVGTNFAASLRPAYLSSHHRDQELFRNMSHMNPDTVLHNVHQSMQQQPTEQEQQQRDERSNDDEELARTAGQLVESVSHDTSQKFVQSRFLALMRQLRDHEVRVDGDKIVETTPTSQIPTSQQDLDLGRGNESSRTMTGALQADGNDGYDIARASSERVPTPMPPVDGGRSYVNGCFFRRDGQLL